MRRGLLACACVLFALLTSCSRPPVPFVYAMPQKSAWEASIGAESNKIKSAQKPQPSAQPSSRPSAQPKEEQPSSQPSPSPLPQTPDGTPKTPEVPSAEETPDVEDAIQQANESLSSSEVSTITDMSVLPEGQRLSFPSQDLTVFSHYIPENDERYQAFIAAFPDLSAALSIGLVNVNADYGFYNGITSIESPGDLLVLCNKNFKLPKDFVPQNLRGVAGTDRQMTDEAATAFESMKKALKDELDLPLTVVSAYRAYDYQDALYTRYAKSDGVSIADTYSARAGHSEHQTGLAIDFLHKAPASSLRAANFQNTAQYAWLVMHAHEYGYILRYPEGCESLTGYIYEPWHWRYIGVEDATCMFEAGIATFEEYIGTYYRANVMVEAG